METLKEYLKQWFAQMIKKYPWIRFEYEESNDGYKHFICVYPRSIIDNNENYCEDEIQFSLLLDQNYPDNGVLFSTENELFSCSDNAKVFKNAEEFPISTTLIPVKELDYHYSNYNNVYWGMEDNFFDYNLAS